MATIYRVSAYEELPWPATDDHPNADIPRYQVPFEGGEGDWDGAPTTPGIWYVSSHGAPTKQEVIDHIDPPAFRNERHRKIDIRAKENRIAMMTVLNTAGSSAMEAYVDTNVTDLAGAIAMLKQILLVISLDTRT